MPIGIPSEVEDHDHRMAITPAGVQELAGRGHEVFVQSGAGEGSSLPDEDDAAAGAKVLGTADEVVSGPVGAAHGLVPADLADVLR